MLSHSPLVAIAEMDLRTSGLVMGVHRVDQPLREIHERHGNIAVRAPIVRGDILHNVDAAGCQTAWETGTGTFW